MMFLFLLYGIIGFAELASSYVIILSKNGDIIQGKTTQFIAEVLHDNGSRVDDIEFKFEWSDNAIPRHTAEFKSKSPAHWNVTYNCSFPTESYKVTVKGYKLMILIMTTIGSTTKKFDVTDFLKGDLVLHQGNVTRKTYVSNAEPVSHQIVLQKSRLDFLNKTKNYFRTFWFVDCIYYGQESGFEFNFNYSVVESMHHVEALLVAAYIPSLSKMHGVVLNSNDTALLNSSLLETSEINGQYGIGGNLSAPKSTVNIDYTDQALLEWLQNYNQTRNSSLSVPNYCINSSVIPITSNYTYGFFRTNFTVKAPVKVSPINGTNWLMDGEVLNITVSCNGSSPYSFCVLLKAGLYNVTNNETCKEETVLRNCSFGIQHLFKRPSEYTLIVIISNSVSHVVKPIAVNIYKVKKHAQLSVIIVPVSFSLIATILIIFGVAYYVQSKRKYTIEVADFDFGNQTSDMEYKSFIERLRESVSNSLLKSHDYLDNDEYGPESVPNSRKYGSME